MYIIRIYAILGNIMPLMVFYLSFACFFFAVYVDGAFFLHRFDIYFLLLY